MSAETLKELLQGIGAVAKDFGSIEDAVEFAIESAGKDGVVAALGSLYFSGDIRRAYNKVTGRNI
jgi:dihydrofolate synthase/folylpolyglutamate synthase